MWKIRLLFISFVLLLLMGCQSGVTLTPTPFPPTSDNVALGVNGSSITPVPAVLADMMANPEFYEGAHVLVTGQYFRNPLQVCGVDPHPSPAGWELVAGDARVGAGGFDAQLRQLVPDGITMTVIGRLAQWQGPVGCGKQAVPMEMWYLDVVKLVNPAQLARVTLTPSGGSDFISDDGIGDDLFTPIAETEGGEASTADDFLPTSPPVAPPTNTSIPATQAVPIETLGAGFTPVADDAVVVSTPTRATGVSGTPTVTTTAVTTAEGTAVNGTTQATRPTVTNTPPPGASLTPVPIGGNTTPIPTSDTGSGVTKMGELDEVEYEMVDIETDALHEWTIPLDEGDEIVIAVIGESTMDMGIKILDEDSIKLVSQDTQSTGQMKSITFDSPSSGDYKVQIYERNGDSGGYLLAIGSEDFLLLYPQGMLTYGDGDSASITWDELHYWFFRGTEGDMIDLAISCNIDSDLAIILYDPEGDNLAEQFIDGDMQDILLTETGWYVLEIEFWDQDDDNCNYNLVVTN